MLNATPTSGIHSTKAITTAQQLADRLGVSRPSVFKYKNHPELMNSDMVKMLANYYDEQVSFQNILEYTKADSKAFVELQTEIAHLLDEDASNSGVKDYTKRVLNALKVEIAKPSSALLRALVREVNGKN